MSAAEVTRLPRPSTPPHDLAAEEALLGAMLLSRDAIDVAVERLTADAFYRPAHGLVFEAIVGLHVAGEVVDLVTVAGELDKAGLLDRAGGRPALMSMSVNTPSTTSAERYAATIADHALMRSLAVAGSEIVEIGMSRPDDVTVALDLAESRVFDLTNRRAPSTVHEVHQSIGTVLDDIEARYERGEPVAGLPTGLFDLDDLLTGLHDDAVYVIGARPSAGKTALGLSIVQNVAIELRVPTLVFSLEMSHKELTQRLLCQTARVDSRKVMKGNLTEHDWGKISHAVGQLAEAPLFIDDDPRATVTSMRSKARRMKAKRGLGLVVVDYLQLMTGHGKPENRQTEIAEISRGLKILARELECPVIALSQLSRGLEMRADKRPMLADLRESGSIEQDADVVMFIYRDELYNADSPDRGTAEIIVAKHRNGPTGVVRLAFLEHCTKFANMART